jgi:hypothetical protein
MAEPEPRRARLVLVRPDGTVLGTTPEIDVATPWWQDTRAVVRAAADHLALPVVVLRLLWTEQRGPQGGRVAYLAETSAERLPPLTPWTDPLDDDHPLRMPWARPGGPAADLAWAHAALHERGLQPAGPPDQVISWNLSSIWRMPLADGTAAWLKHVPPFMAHEGTLLTALAGGPVPSLLAHDGARILMAELPGIDQHDADVPTLERLMDHLVDLQTARIGRADQLLAMGLPDWRGPALTVAIREVVARWQDTLDPSAATALDAFVTDLPDRMAAIERAGPPPTLVHGDAHPGNARGDGARLALLDWGDSGVGHPLLDQPAYLHRVPPAEVDRLRARWHAAWRRLVPGSDPDEAERLLRPVAAARQAVIYQRFLDGIEPSEHPYHQDDPAEWLTRAAELVQAE